MNIKKIKTDDLTGKADINTKHWSIGQKETTSHLPDVREPQEYLDQGAHTSLTIKCKTF